MRDSVERRIIPKDPELYGLAWGRDVYILSTCGSNDTFSMAFHELGHIVDTQFDLKSSLKPLAERQKVTISFTPSQRDWLLKQDKEKWTRTGLTIFHMGIIKTVMQAILKDGLYLDYKMHRISPEGIQKTMQESGIHGSVVKKGKLEISNYKEHRNSEFPADYLVKICLDVLNRSVNKEFNLAENTVAFSYNPGERNKHTDKIAQFVLDRGLAPPGYIFHQVKKQ